MSSDRPPRPPSAASDDGAGSDARTAPILLRPRPISALPADDGLQSIPEHDFVEAPDESAPDGPPTPIAAAVEPDADVTARQRAWADGGSIPGSVPPAEDEDADSTARRHLADEDALPERERAFGPFTLLRRLAFGGMGEVFLARRDTHLPAGLGPAPTRLVVVKRILAHMRRDEKQRRAFVEEARLQSLLRSPHIVQILDVGEVDEQVYLAMEHVNGPSWRSLIDRCRRNKQHIPLGYIVDMMIQVADGLSYAHNLVDASSGQALRVVHRDVNPHNVLVTYDGDVKLIDFGIAKSDLSLQHTETGTIKGKFAYMSPEQSAAEPLDARSDLFALGICFYELATLANPFKRGNVVLSLEAIQRTTPPPPSRSRPGAALLDPLIERMLRKNPDDRFADCSEVADALRLLVQDGLVPEPQQPLATWMRALFASEIENHRRILEQTGTLVDVVSTAPRPPRPHSSSSLRALPRTGLDRTGAPTSATPAPVATAPEQFVDSDLAPSGRRPPRDGQGTGPTGALHRSKTTSRRRASLLASTVILLTAAAAGVGWFVLRPVPVVVHAQDAGPSVAPTTDAGTAALVAVDAGAGAAGDAGAAAIVTRDGGATVEEAAAVAADGGTVEAVRADAGDGGDGLVPIADAGPAELEPSRPVTMKIPRMPAVGDAANDIVARIAVAADGFVVKGPRTLGSRLPSVLVVDDRQAPFKLRLKLRNTADGARVSIDSEPWAIVRVDQIGRGRTPVVDVPVAAGKKVLLSLQNPGGAVMEVSLTLTPTRPSH